MIKGKHGLAIPMKVKFILLIGVILLFTRCKKDGKGCWQAFSPQGYDVAGLLLCDRTKAEAEAAWPQYWFHRSGERKYCWYVEIGVNKYYAWDIPESMAQKYMETNGGYHFTKIDCASFCSCQWMEKRRSKITGNYQPNRVFTETLTSRDTCSKLFVGRVIVITETTDSLITRELLEKHP